MVVGCERTRGGGGDERAGKIVPSSAETPAASTSIGPVIAAPATFLDASCAPCLGGGETGTPCVTRAAAETTAAGGVDDGAPACTACGGFAARPPEPLAAAAPAPSFSGDGTDALPSCWPCAGKACDENCTAPGTPAGACTATRTCALLCEHVHCERARIVLGRDAARRTPHAARRTPQYGHTACRWVGAAERGKWYFCCCWAGAGVLFAWAAVPWRAPATGWRRSTCSALNSCQERTHRRHTPPALTRCAVAAEHSHTHTHTHTHTAQCRPGSLLTRWGCTAHLSVKHATSLGRAL